MGDSPSQHVVTRFGPAVDELPLVVFETDARGAVTYINAHWTSLTGQSNERAMGLGWTERIHSEDLGTIMSEWRSGCIEAHSRTVDFRLLTKEGTLAWLRCVTAPVLKGEEVVAFVGVSYDAREHHDTKSAIALVRDEVRRLEERNEALLSAIPDVLFHLDAVGTFLSFRAPPGTDPAMKPDAFIGRTVAQVLPQSIAEAATRAMARARASGDVQRFEYQMMGSDISAGLRNFEARVTPMKTGDFLFTIRDVSEAKQFENELIVAREQALESTRLKSAFLANVSHEIRTPLNGILGVTQLLRTLPLPADAKEYVDVLESAGESLLDIVNDVLDLSKIEANRLELESTVFDLEQVVAGAVNTVSPQASRKGLALEVDFAASARGALMGDPGRTRQVVSNLLSNAVKFTERGRVSVKVTRAGDEVRLVVSDTGPGIAREMQERIFEPFVQDARVARRFGGTGLGLSITRRIARLMNGDVSVTSTPGQGATFEVRLVLPPVVAPPAPTRPKRELTMRSLRVLLAEDDEINAAMTSALLSRLGHSVDTVSTGERAVKAVAAKPFDLVIMDVQMPEMDGLEATRVIRQSERGTAQHLPIVALTANALKGDDLLCLSAGMDAYLPKPVTVDALRDVLSWFGSLGRRENA